MDYRYFEDFAPGQSYETQPLVISEAEIIEFATPSRCTRTRWPPLPSPAV
jgi:hypothetical protein